MSACPSGPLKRHSVSWRAGVDHVAACPQQPAGSRVVGPDCTIVRFAIPNMSEGSGPHFPLSDVLMQDDPPIHDERLPCHEIAVRRCQKDGGPNEVLRVLGTLQYAG